MVVWKAIVRNLNLVLRLKNSPFISAMEKGSFETVVVVQGGDCDVDSGDG